MANTKAVTKSSNIAGKKANLSAVKDIQITNDERQSRIAEIAYYLAEERGFNGGDPVEDWLLAEQQVEKTY